MHSHMIGHARTSTFHVKLELYESKVHVHAPLPPPLPPTSNYNTYNPSLSVKNTNQHVTHLHHYTKNHI